MKLNVGDYVRTKYGYIAKIVNIEKKKENYDYVTYYFDKKVGQYGWDDGNIYDITTLEINDTSFKENKDMIIKSSPNIIDLIEVGDIVINQLGEIIRITSGNIDELKDYWKICENPIKSIVTKEQFESVKYNLESEVIKSEYKHL